MREPTQQPNIIVVNCDDLGYGDLGCYGSKVNDTPVLDDLAAEGIRFTSFYAASPVCSPSRASLLTGCYPTRVGFDRFENDMPVLFPGYATGLHRDEYTIADLLKRQGYATKIVGKWHCGDQPEFLPTEHGFDSYYGLPYSNDMGWQAGVGRRGYPPLPLLEDEEIVQLQPDQASLTERYVEHSVRFIRDHSDQPFFLYFAHMHVHLPLYVASPFLAQSRNGPYGGAVAAIDWAMGVLQYELRRLGIDRNTLIVFTSDNGARGDYGSSNGPLRGGKGTTWEGGMRVPGIVHWPGVLSGGRVSDEIATHMDILPTVVRLAGGDVPADRTIDGHDLRPLLFDEPGAQSPYDAFFYYWMDHLEAVRVGRWKLHAAKRGEETFALYDLAADIGETRDVSADHPDVVQKLQEAMAVCREDLGDERMGIVGRGCRPIGRVAEPVQLTLEDAEDYPLMAAEYDLSDQG